MTQTTVKTAYGYGIISNDTEKRHLLDRISNATSIRNKRFPEFFKEIDLLLNKYEL